MIPKIEVVACWDPEAGVWVATSEDLPGLITEAATVEELRQKLSAMVPELMELNGLANHQTRQIPLCLVARSQEMISLHD